VPLISSNNGHTISAFPGFDPLTGTLMSNEMRNFTIEAGPARPSTSDLGDGRGLKATVFGANFEQKIGGWDVSNKLNVFSGDLNTIAMFTGNNPLTAVPTSQAIAGQHGNRGHGRGGRRPGRLGHRYLCAAAAARSTEPAGGAGRPVVGREKQLRSFTDELRVSRELGKDNTSPSAPTSPTTRRTTSGTWATAT
jgi:iron complex outermembrane receptor protein